MLFTWVIFSLVVMFVSVAIMSIVRAILNVRRLRNEPPEPPLNVDFAMADLHDMLAKGQITAEEFEQLRESVLLRAQVREALLRESQMRQPPVGHAFQVIQKPPPLPPAAGPVAAPPPVAPPAAPVAPGPPPAPLPESFAPVVPPGAGEDVGGGAGSRDAR